MHNGINARSIAIASGIAAISMFILGFAFNVSLVKLDALSNSASLVKLAQVVNYATSSGTSSTSTGTCNPTTCGSAVCGVFNDGCGGSITCGVCGGETYCNLGRCVALTSGSTTPANCSDSDSGDIVAQKGVTTAGSFSATDSCFVSGKTQSAETGNQLSEYYCTNDKIARTIYSCTCENGACADTPIASDVQPICRDDDGGFTLNQKGTVTVGILGATDCCLLNLYSKQCVNAGPYVAENSCSPLGSIKTEVSFCAKGCYQGACQPTASNQSPTAKASVNSSATTNTLTVFDGSQSNDPDGYIKLYNWTFSDNTVLVTEFGKLVRTFTKIGNYSGMLTTVDAKGAVSTGQPFNFSVTSPRPERESIFRILSR